MEESWDDRIVRHLRFSQVLLLLKTLYISQKSYLTLRFLCENIVEVNAIVFIGIDFF